MTDDAAKGSRLWSFLLRAFVWAGVSGALLAAGLYAVGAALVALSAHQQGTSLGKIQIAALHAVFMAVLSEALLPHGILTLATWLVVARLVPRLEGTWRSLSLSIVAVAALWFPAVGFILFRAWKPTSPLDVVKTWLLMTASVAAALLVARRVLPPLAPGALARPVRRSTLGGA